MNELINTIINRPYVVAFLVAFLVLSIRHQGLVKTLIWLIVGYFIAFLSEYSSINNGFPYGEYHYIYENMKGELFLAGVPVWDSISYSFLTYAGYSLAVYSFSRGKAWHHWILGSIFTMILDIITDPVAKLGKDWFLGEIYYYAHDGVYFHIPWTNFAGWLLVSAVIIGTNLIIFHILKLKDRTSPNILNLLFYISICLFNTIIAFSIGAILLGFVNLGITLLMAFCGARHLPACR